MPAKRSTQATADTAAPEATLTAQGAAGAAVPTFYGPYPATATEATIRLKPDAHPSRWWMEKGLGGREVSVLVIEYQPDPNKPSKRVYIYDEDGDGTLKFVQHAGSGAYGHQEVEP